MKLLIRTEASNRIGMGHFMRCFALAEAACGRGWAVGFLLSEACEAAQNRCDLIGAQFDIVPAPLGQDAEHLVRMTSDWLVVDSYAAYEAYLARLSAHHRLAVVDDLARLKTFECRLLINPALAAPDMGYERLAPGAQRLLGPDYALIRSEFRQSYAPPQAPFIAVMFGGSDPDNLTAACVRLLRQSLPEMPVRVIAGPANRQVQSLEALADADAHMDLYVDPPSVAQVLAHANLVITAAGGTLGEVAAMGLSALALVVYDNQVAALEQSLFPVIDARKGLPDNLGEQATHLMADKAVLQSIGAHAHTLVDGQGARRILEVMEAMHV